MTEATLVDVTRLSPDVRQYVVELTEGEFDGEAGQHTLIENDDGDIKPYSILGVDANQAILMIRNYGGEGVSNYMGEREIGDTIEIEPDLNGNLTLDDPDRPIALLATGTGVTPMIGILNNYIEQGCREDAVFLFGDKNKEQTLYKNMIKQYEVLHDVESEYVLSREEWHGREGYVQQHIEDVIDDVGPDTERDFYVCGVPKMVVQTKEMLEDLGVPSERIHSEGWETA